MDEEQTIEKRRGRIVVTVLAAVVALLLMGVAVWFWRADIYTLLTDQRAVEALVTRMGVWGPLALILLNIVQIVIAPIPGYIVQLAAGYLYGPLLGGIYAAIGIVAGAMVAMWLARTLGRPVAVLLIGESRLARWETVTYSDSPWVWVLLLLGPVGDVPYSLAGLSRVRYSTIFLITLVIRVPSAFLSTAIGGGAVPLVWLFVLVGVAGLMVLIGWRYKEPLHAWYARTLNASSTPLPIPLPIPIPVLEPGQDEADCSN